VSYPLAVSVMLVVDKSNNAARSVRVLQHDLPRTRLGTLCPVRESGHDAEDSGGDRPNSYLR
jgi:hypothetical protein